MYLCDSIRLDKISSHGEIRKQQQDDTLNSVLIQLNQKIFLTACSVMLPFEAHLFMNNPNSSIFFGCKLGKLDWNSKLNLKSLSALLKYLIQ